MCTFKWLGVEVQAGFGFGTSGVSVTPRMENQVEMIKGDYMEAGLYSVLQSPKML